MIASVLGPRERGLVLVSLVATLVAAAAEVAMVAQVGRLVGSLESGTPTTFWLLLSAAAWAAATALAVVAGRHGGYCMSQALHRSLAAHLLRLPLAWFGQRRDGEISHLLGPQVMGVMSIPAHLMVPTLRAVAVPLGLVGLIASFDLVPALVAVAWLPVLAVTQWWSARRAAQGDRALAEARAEGANRVIEYVGGQRTLRMLPDPEHASALVTGSVRRVACAMEAQVGPVVRVLGVFSLAVHLMLVTVLGAGLVRHPAPAPGDAAVFVLATVALVATLHAAAELAATIRAAMGSAAAVRDFLTIPVLPEPAAPQDPPRRGEIVVEGLGVGTDPAILRDISFTVLPGSFTAIIGPSGAGKTTLLRLLARFADPVAGRVAIDGVDVRDIGTRGVHERIAMVFQDVELLTGTIADNIGLGGIEATEADLERAVTRAGMTEMVQRLPQGLQTPVGEHGTGLSGGERQRVSIARALLKDAPILLLDEPASSLDGHHQHVIADTLAALRGQATVVLVTHRVTSARAADQIVMLEQGRLVERGRHDDLLSHDGPYAALWRSSMRIPADHT